MLRQQRLRDSFVMAHHIKKQIMKDTAKLTSAQYFSQGLGFVTSIMIRRYLGPYFTGIWSLLRIILDYSAYNSLGVDRAAMYKIPFFIGQNKQEEVREIQNCSFSFMFLASLLTSVLLAIITTFIKHRYPIEVVVGLYALSIIAIVEKISAFLILLPKAEGDFSVLSKAIIFDAILNITLVFLLVRPFFIYGLYTMMFLSAVINAVFVYSLIKCKVKLIIDTKIIKGLIKYGFPILGISLLTVILRSVDRIIIAKMLGVTFVGYFSLGIMTRNYAEIFASFSTVLRPRMMQAYGKEEKIEHMEKFVIGSCEIIAFTLPIILSIIYFLGPVLVRLLLPKFIPGIIVMQILLLDSFFHSTYIQSQQFIIAIGKQKKIMAIITGVIILNGILDYFLIKMGLGIAGVAASTAFSSFLSFILVQIVSMRYFMNNKDIIFFIIRVLVPVFYISLVSIFIGNIILVANQVIDLLLKIVIVLTSSLPLLFYLNRRINFIPVLVSLIKGKFGIKDDNYTDLI
ncbi:MAG: oligosaccharide flippase family protein [Patescibacteria group bacterium]